MHINNQRDNHNPERKKISLNEYRKMNPGSEVGESHSVPSFGLKRQNRWLARLHERLERRIKLYKLTEFLSFTNDFFNVLAKELI